MGNASPESLVDAISKRLTSRILNSGRTGELTAFERAQAERDIEAVAKTDARTAFLLRGLLGTLEGDIQAAEVNFERARRLNSPDAVAQRLYALSNLGYAERALSLLQTEIQAGTLPLSDLIMAAVPVGAVTSAARAIEVSRSAGLVLAPKANPSIELAMRAAQSLDLAGLKEEELVALVDIAGQVMRERRLLWLDRSPEIIALTGTESDDSAPGVHYLFRIDETPREAAALTGEVGWRALQADVSRPGLSVAFVGARAERLAA